MVADRNNKIRQQSFLALLIALGLFLFYLLSTYFVPFLGAVIFFVLFKKPLRYLTDKKGFSPMWAALILILLSLLIVTLPTLFLTNVLVGKITQILNDPQSLINVIHVIDDKAKVYLNMELLSERNIAIIKEKAGSLLPDLLSGTLNMFGQILIMYFILYYLLTNAKLLPAFFETYFPLDRASLDLFDDELEAMTMSNVIGAPLLATIQSIAAILAFWFFGLQEPVFWGLICGLFSFIPFVGSAAIWLPAAIYQLSTGLTWQGTALLIYGVLVISNIDNVFRFVLQKKFADVHPLVTVFGVLIGLELFSLPGVIFGPLMISYFLLGVKIYRKWYLISDENGSDSI